MCKNVRLKIFYFMLINFNSVKVAVCYHATQIFKTFHILQLFLSFVIVTGDGCLGILITFVFFHIQFHAIVSTSFN